MNNSFNYSHGIIDRYTCSTRIFNEIVDRYYIVIQTIQNIVKTVQSDIKKSYQTRRNPKKPFIFLKHITLKNFLTHLKEVCKNLVFLNRYLCPFHKLLCGESQFAHRVWLSSFKTYESEAYKLLENTPYQPNFSWKINLSS